MKALQWQPLEASATIDPPVVRDIVGPGIDKSKEMHPAEAHCRPILQDGRLEDALPVHVGLRVAGAGRDGDQAVGVRDDAVAGLDGGPVQREGVRRGAGGGPLAAHLRHVGGQAVRLARLARDAARHGARPVAVGLAGGRHLQQERQRGAVTVPLAVPLALVGHGGGLPLALALALALPAPRRHLLRLLLALARVEVRRPAPHVEHDGPCNTKQLLSINWLSFISHTHFLG